jgi:hypothetical protein
LPKLYACTAISFGVAPVTNGLFKHIDASALSGMYSDGDSVSVATDLAGVQNMVQSTAANRPTYETNAMNGMPVLRFDGTDDFLEAQNLTTTYLNGDQAFTVFSVSTLQSWGPLDPSTDNTAFQRTLFQLGDGQVGSDKFLDTLKEIGYEGTLAIEREAGDSRADDIALAAKRVKEYMS